MKSDIIYQPYLFNDSNATANHVKDVVNRMPELQTAPGHQDLWRVEAENEAAADTFGAEDMAMTKAADMKAVLVVV